MKTLVVGTGIIGTTYAWALARAGIDVTHLVRPGRETGMVTIKVDVLDERKDHPKNPVETYDAKVVDGFSSADGYDLIIVPVNGDQLDAALATLVDRAGDALVLIMTSRWDGPEPIDQRLPRERYLMAYPDGGGTMRDGVCWTNIGAELHVGLLEGQPAQSLETVRKVFAQADIALDVQENMIHWLWVHNASAIGFAAGFAKSRDIRTTFRDGALLSTCFKATRELLALCAARGVDLKKFPEIGYMSWPIWLNRLLMRFIYATNASMKRFTAHAGSPGSLRETRATYEAMVRTADTLGIAVPNLRSLGMYLQPIPGTGAGQP